MTVQQIFDLLQELAPFELQEEWDNSGLLVGSFTPEIDAVLFALDATLPVIQEAERKGAGLIVTHHPLMFSPLKRVTEDDYEGRLIRRLIRSDLSLIAAHTNLDRASGGTNDTLAALMGLTHVTGEGFLRAGDLPEPLSAADFANLLRERLGDAVRLMGPETALIHRVGLCTGAGGSEWEQAAALGCDAFVSGEIKHHLALAMADSGIVALECGHFATEQPGIFALADALQNRLNPLQCNLRIFKSESEAYAFPPRPGAGG